MNRTASKNRNILLVSLLALIFAGGYAYTKYNYAKQVSGEIDNLIPFHHERLELKEVSASEKNFILQLTISGVTSSSERIAELKSYYDDVAVNYVCKSSSFKSQFDDGYQISFDIKYQNEPDTTFKKMYVSKEQCANVRT
ncbi:hypothetical protein A5320_14305 [Rheinheimera sp. SA_1]|uniref:hypothetical protein n=1 Tax=Rheinheimera sp. SA_1 TaxID=1827365 RepID=UPI0007FFFBE3|nr:hypothetical protein [Rheinheimera sp. SA_1]OBP14880.1 hypothetical protein A5320_14305 [Rheinheimera sp. SA_1]